MTIATLTICTRRPFSTPPGSRFGSISRDDEQRLLLITKRLKYLYEEHIQVEAKIVFPRAAKMLDSQAIADIGREFRKRRE